LPNSSISSVNVVVFTGMPLLAFVAAGTTVYLDVASNMIIFASDVIPFLDSVDLVVA
jgi:hypothetical protein